MNVRAIQWILLSLASTAAAVAQQRPIDGLSPVQDAAIAADRDSPGRSAPRRRIHLRPDGSTRAVGSFRSRVYLGTPGEAGRAFLKDNPSLLDSIDPDQLQELPTRRIGARAFARFQQQIDGIPVRGAHAVVAFNASKEADSFTSNLEPRLRVTRTWNLSADDALSRVRAQLDLAEPPTPQKVYVARNGEAVPAWRVVARSANPPGLWEYLVSADDGSILETQNLRKGQRAFGYAYPRSPLAGPAETVSLDGLGASDRLTSDQTTVYNYLPAVLGQVSPKTLVQMARRQDGNFLYAPENPRFSEVQLFYGMQRANAHFRDLGFPGWDTPLAGVVLYQDYDAKQGRFVGADNAYFSPEDLTPNGGLFFYLTAKNGDTSLDSDVIFHEYTHAIVEYAVGGGQTKRFQAINEGTADYFSDSFMDDPVEAEYASRLFGLRTSFLRRADNQNRWPANVVGEAHADGNIWSGALWDVRKLFGATAADRIAINAIASLAPDADFFDAAAAAVDAAAALYSDDAADLVAAIMADRGILTDAAQTASESLLLGDTAYRGRISAASPGYVRLGAQQYRVDVPLGATRLNIHVSATSDVRFFIRFRTPITIENGAIVAEQVSQTGAEVSGSLTLANIPELRAGTYYIAVVNSTAAPVTYQVQAEAQGDNLGKTLITLLNNGETGSGSLPAGPILASHQFAIDVPAGVSALRVTLDGDHDVDLYIRYNGPVYSGGTGYPEADVAAATDSAHEEAVLRLANGGPLPAGRYVLAVLNYSDRTAQYRIQAYFDAPPGS